MATISIIVAVDKKNAIGKNNQLLCHLPNDLKYFKKTTQGHSVIMGRNTFESLPNGALPNRRNIVITRKECYKAENCEIVKSLAEAINECENEQEVFIIGGAMLYNEAIKIADKLYVTHIHHTFDGADTFFPVINNEIWKEISSTDNEVDEKNKYPHTFVVYTK